MVLLITEFTVIFNLRTELFTMTVRGNEPGAYSITEAGAYVHDGMLDANGYDIITLDPKVMYIGGFVGLHTFCVSPSGTPKICKDITISAYCSPLSSQLTFPV